MVAVHMFLYILVRPFTSSDLTVSISAGCMLRRMLPAPTLPSPRNVTTELCLTTQRLLSNQAVRTVERACILSSTRWFSFSMYMYQRLPDARTVHQCDHRTGGSAGSRQVAKFQQLFNFCFFRTSNTGVAIGIPLRRFSARRITLHR